MSATPLTGQLPDLQPGSPLQLLFALQPRGKLPRLLETAALYLLPSRIFHSASFLDVVVCNFGVQMPHRPDTCWMSS